MSNKLCSLNIASPVIPCAVVLH